ncbi:hypothetical protein TPELB_21290 [Terrisporobacter petrolearius]|uniref:Peptidase C14A caspase catalytic domain-containing protein n=1 Tax=Terrisporobacter petrolearius TaxID=1460447 RepID=A0ABZ3FDB7_9FIRM
MQKKAILFSASEYLNSRNYPKPSLDLQGVNYDVLAIEKRLNQIGFNVVKKENAHKNEYLSTLKKSVRNSPNDAIHIVYFSGHGGHYNGNNYIYPSDFAAQYDKTKNIDFSSINIEDIISVFKDKGKLILILDACRNDFGESKGYYSEMTSSENVYIAYSTMFKNVSYATDKISWFTEAICDEILIPNIDVDTLFMKVRKNIFSRHCEQVPPSVNSLLEEVILHSEPSYNDDDKKVHDFIEKFGEKYNDKYGYFHGDDLIFIDAAQYFDISFLDAFWKFKKLENKILRDNGGEPAELTEAESKLVTFLGLTKSKEFFYCDESYTWYYNGRQIRMGEIPPIPPSMQCKLPDKGKEIHLKFNTKKENGNIIIETNLPELSEIFVCNSKYTVNNGKIIISNSNEILKVDVDSGVWTSDEKVKQILGDKCRNLVGEYVKYHPIRGNYITYSYEL